eukprot:Anaeramoba_ignava/a349892_182.p1 GENE.a349892_182~~a349892_182.p1  ORF type:complete len:317 (+),score=-4.61 a349892_182:178-1128(+)
MSFKIRYFLKSMLLWILAFSFLSFLPVEIDAAPKKKAAASKKKKKRSKKRKKKKVSRTKKRKQAAKRKKRKKRRRRSKKKRHYNPSKTIAMAKEMIRKNSLEVSALAGLIPSIDSSVSLEQNDTIACLTKSEADILMDEFESFMEDEEEIPDMRTFKILWLRYAEDGNYGDLTEAGIIKQEIMDQIMDWLGTPYFFGGTSKSSIDCSAFTRRIYMDAANIKIPRVARDQIHVGRTIARNDLEFGDLIFFHTYTNKFPSHVGIYLGDNLFAHASSRYGVTVSSLSSPYYRSHYIGGRRLTVHDVMRYSLDNKDKHYN